MTDPLRRWVEDVLDDLHRVKLDLLRERGEDDPEHVLELELESRERRRRYAAIKRQMGNEP